MAQRRIYKYPFELPGSGIAVVRLRVGAKVLSVGTQRPGWITLWVEVDPEAVEQNRTFFVVGTGHHIPERAGRFLGTVFDGPFVWHVYEAKAE